MQLKRHQTIRAGLSTACLTLLSQGPNADAHDNSWEYETGLLLYSEENRTSGVEWIMEGRFDQDDDEQLILSLEIDSVVGASPNGVAASNQAQTFTTPSGRDTYTVPANTLPVDPTFNDQRLGVSVEKITPLSRDHRLSYGSAFSQEFDYLNVDFNMELQQDFNLKNTVLIYGAWASYNRVHPVGGIPTGLASMVSAGSLQPRETAARTKRQAKGWIGLTQNLDRHSRINVNFEIHHQNGYLTDPYKLVGVVDDVNIPTLGEPVDVIYENRPEDRRTYTLSTTYKHFIKPDVVKLGLRFATDTWEVQSTTLDLGYQFRKNDSSYWEPLVRIYHQSAAEFYRHSLVQSEMVPDYVSSDFRLADFTALTMGFSYSPEPAKNSRSKWQILYYQQAGEHSPSNAVGAQTEQDLFPTLKTLILQYVYSVEW